MKSKQAQSTSFYDARKQCRKTVYDTPEHLSEADWFFLRKLAAVLADPFRSGDDIHTLLYGSGVGAPPETELTKRFFDHVIGWPEGYIYCRDRQYFRVAGGQMFRRDAPRLIFALLRRQEQLREEMINNRKS